MKIKSSLAALALTIALAVPAGASAGLYSVSGHIAAQGGETSRQIGAAELTAIGETVIETKVLTLGDGLHKVKGVLGRDLLDYVGGTGETVRVVALDGYTMEIPVADFRAYDVVIATEIDGKALSVRDKGPAWIIYPVSQHKELDDTVYEARSVWQIKSILVD